MSTATATATLISAYAEAYNQAWIAMEDAISALGSLNDTLYRGEALVQRAPGADVDLMRELAKKLKDQLDCLEIAKEPKRLSPILPGEIRYES
jgi:ABC-type amino acid transport substrate-binding protein